MMESKDPAGLGRLLGCAAPLPKNGIPEDDIRACSCATLLSALVPKVSNQCPGGEWLVCHSSVCACTWPSPCELLCSIAGGFSIFLLFYFLFFSPLLFVSKLSKHQH